MAVETKLSLEHDTIDKLQDLIQANMDSYRGLLDAADRVDNGQVGSLFREIAAQRSSHAAELKGLVSANGEEPEQEGSLGAAIQRAWMNVKAHLPGDRTHSILKSAEEAEDSLMDQYEHALREIAGSAVTDVLNRQFANVSATHDRVKMLRDAQAPTA
jgi:uncharacterized protein (TIGR02284 family)